MAYSWQNKTIEAGQTNTYSVVIGIGGAESSEVLGYSVSYNDNVPDIVIDVPETQQKLPNVALTLSNEIPVRSGYAFIGWNTKPNGEGTNYAPGATYTANQNLILYAQWEEGCTFPVTDANQGTQTGGKITFNKDSAAEDDTVIITVTPDKGYKGGEPAVLDSNKQPIAVTDNGDGTFSFIMPASGVSVDVNFSRINYFDDVTNRDWFDEPSWFCAAHGLMIGTKHRQFDGHIGTNRAMLVTVLYRLANGTDNFENIFKDVASGKWYSEAIVWAANNKIVKGYGNGNFGPEDKLTREQLVTILYRYSQFMEYDVSKQSDLKSFTDANSVSKWSLEAMKWAVGNDLIIGIGNNRLSPETGASRAQLATILQRYVKTFVMQPTT
ncbi:MAG: S-layer homology domain-containing protein [Bacillota bacterium]|jgi:uncharacterized repeat protein (TIGR02543 family)